MRPSILCAIAAVALMVGGCVHPGFSLLNLGPKPGAANASSTPKPPICAGFMLADPEPMPALPPTAGFPAPATPAEGAAVAAYGAWLHSFALWATHGWDRVGRDQAYCAGKPAP